MKYALDGTYLRERLQRIYSRAVNGTSIHGAHRENVTLLVHHDKWHVITLAISWSFCAFQGKVIVNIIWKHLIPNTIQIVVIFYDIKRNFELLLGLNYQFYCVAKLLKTPRQFHLLNIAYM